MEIGGVMYYLSLGDSLSIPLTMISAFSYNRRARAIQHRNGFVSTRGFEASEISIRLNLNHAVCKVIGVSLADELNSFRALSVARSADKGPVYLGEVPIMGTMKFAVTSVNITETSDFCEADAAEIELILSPVDVMPKQEETPDVENPLEFPSITILSKSLESLGVPVKIESFVQTESETQIELIIGADTDVLDVSSWIEPLLQFIEIPIKSALPTTQTIVSCETGEGSIRLNLSFFGALARKAFSTTYENTTLAAILEDVATRGGFTLGEVPNLSISYYAVHGLNPIQALAQIAESLGYLINFHGSEIDVVEVPTVISATKTLLDASAGDWAKTPEITGVTVKTGWLDELVGSGSNSITVELPCRPDDLSVVGENVVKSLNYKLNSIEVEIPIDTEIVHHSPVKILKGATELVGLVEHFETDYCAGQMKLTVCII